MTEAPEGMFFVVRRESFGFVAVQLRQKRKRFGSRLVADSLVYPGEFPSGSDAVEFGKGRAVERWKQRQEEARKYREALNTHI